MNHSSSSRVIMTEEGSAEHFVSHVRDTMITGRRGGGVGKTCTGVILLDAFDHRLACVISCGILASMVGLSPGWGKRRSSFPFLSLMITTCAVFSVAVS